MDLLGETTKRKTKFGCITRKAKENPNEVFTSLAHHLTEEFLTSSFRRLRKSAASGIDKVSGHEYELNLSERIESLHHRLRTKQYKAPDIRRVWIEKEGGKHRPLGISTTEDKIVQRAVTDILNLIYEQDFYNFSYGFRSNRNAHQALSHVKTKCMRRKIKWVLDADIKGCFDNFDHKILRNLLSKRINDPGIMRLINQWLKAGIVDGKIFHRNSKGSPQGNIVSPLLCNIYLHYVLDEWMDKTVRPLLKGEMFIVRYADDFIIGFERKDDAMRVYKTLPKRMRKYELDIHPDKSQLVKFVPDGKGKPPTFDFLGFTHYWTKTKRGKVMVRQRTCKKKMHKAQSMLRECCKRTRHERLHVQYKQLCSKLRGLYQYFGIVGNYSCIRKFYQTVLAAWYKWLNRRSQKYSYTRKQFEELLKTFPLPKPKIVHKSM